MWGGILHSYGPQGHQMTSRCGKSIAWHARQDCKDRPGSVYGQVKDRRWAYLAADGARHGGDVDGLGSALPGALEKQRLNADVGELHPGHAALIAHCYGQAPACKDRTKFLLHTAGCA